MTNKKFVTLCHPVHTVDKQLLLPADTELSEETLNGLLSSSDIDSYPSASLLHHGSVESDLRHFLNSPPYDVIFSDQKQIADLFRIMARVHTLCPILDSLDYFHRHDFYTYRHILMVFSLSTLLAKDLVSDFHEWVREAVAGITHDLGKVCVPLNILKKRVPLTRTERSIIEHHAAAGYVLLCYYSRDNQGLAPTTARDHHERRDGSGYPSSIPLNDPLVEIIAVSDIYDALISSRAYRPVSYDNRTALEEITSMMEQDKIGREVVRALIAHNRKNKPHYSDVSVSFEKRGLPPAGNVYGITVEENGPD
jgi:HD-GYP domain-containing protein (c-di-GMP phosphodiesterase class II)